MNNDLAGKLSTFARNLENLSLKVRSGATSLDEAARQFKDIYAEMRAQGTSSGTGAGAVSGTATADASAAVSLAGATRRTPSTTGTPATGSNTPTAATPSQPLDLTPYMTPDNPLPVPDDIVGKRTYTSREGVTWHRVGWGNDGVFKYANDAGESIYVKPDGSKGYSTLSAEQYQKSRNGVGLPDKIVSNDGIRSVKVVDSSGYVWYKADPAVYGEYKGAWNPHNIDLSPDWTEEQIKAVLAKQEYARAQHEKIWDTSVPVNEVNKKLYQQYGVNTA